MSSVYYYIPALLLLVSFVLRVPGLVRHWRDPLVRSVAVVIPLGAVVFFFAAPPTVSAVNALTGVANFSAPLVYAVVTAGSAGVINLMLTWQGGPEERRRAATLWCAGVYGAVIVTLLALFALGDAPDERLQDFDTYYSTTPYLREMIVLYLVAHAVATAVLSVLCWRWAREVTGLLRAGLVLIVAGGVLGLGYTAGKLLAVGARWTGHDWDGISTTVAPSMAALSSLLQCIGFALPTVGHSLHKQWRRRSRYHRLGPLWEIMRLVIPYELVRIPPWSSLSRRHLRRTCDIRDGLRLLAPYLEHRAGTDVRGPGRATVPGALKPGAAEHAALVVAAFDSLRTRPCDGDGDGSVQSLIDSDDGLVRLSDAVRVMAARGGYATAGHGRNGHGRTGHDPSAAPRKAVS
ncbi:MAB_1171c family putative transporter [Streptomyces sp. NPDC001389]|uniref:MAB_1171c family putative transporter n=1 Tax=Streptomyces sp. NPDC001389 TaxID=3364569 RepID=UPI0036A68C2F